MKTLKMTTTKCLIVFCAALALLEPMLAQPYIGGAYDIGEGRHGERRGDLGPAGIAGITIGAVAVCAALIVTVYFCYYASTNSSSDPHPNTKHYRMAGNA